MKVLVTGADGFLGKNLCTYLSSNDSITVLKFTRADKFEILCSLMIDIDFIFHFAGINRPENEDEYFQGNTDLTKALCDAIKENNRKIPIVFSSSVQAGSTGAYGHSKRLAEQHLLSLQDQLGNKLYIFRLPNVFGKWCKPNYNSVVATFCHNIINRVPINIHDPKKVISLVYVDDLISQFFELLKSKPTHVTGPDFREIEPQYSISIGNLAETIKKFHNSRKKGYIESVGTGLTRALYSTFISYLEPQHFSYNLTKNEDQRGVFVEVLKSTSSGQVSYFTALPGITRGGHYHDSKTEKFVVVRGKARFRFKNILTGEIFEIVTDHKVPTVVETVPGWAHDITNTGSDEMLVILWANEVFDKLNPDTFSYPLMTD